MSASMNGLTSLGFSVASPFRIAWLPPSDWK